MIYEFAIFDLSFELQTQLLRVQFVERIKGWGRLQQRVGAQQHRGVGEEAHDPRQLQAIEKDLAQAQLVFLIRLRRFDPRADLLQQALRGLRVQRQQPQQRFVRGGGVGELAREAEFEQHDPDLARKVRLGSQVEDAVGRGRHAPALTRGIVPAIPGWEDQQPLPAQAR